MTRAELMKQLAEIATRPLIEDTHQSAVQEAPPPAVRELFVWFEDTSARAIDGRRGIAGLPESLLPLAAGLRVVERRFAEGHMPRINGYELLRQIRADSALKTLPVLLITSEASKDDVLQAIRLGANGTILKPLTKSSLEEKVRNIQLRSSAWPSCAATHPATSVQALPPTASTATPRSA